MIKRLAKLKQYGDGKDVSKFMKDEFRQNMLAIESAFRDVNDNLGYSASDVGSLTVANNSEGLVVLTPFSDPQSLTENNKYTAYTEGTYLFDYSIKNLYVNGIKLIELIVKVNDTQQLSIPLFEFNQTTSLRLSPSGKFKIQLNIDSVVSFFIKNTSSANSNTCTIDGGLLIAERLEV